MIGVAVATAAAVVVVAVAAVVAVVVVVVAVVVAAVVVVVAAVIVAIVVAVVFATLIRCCYRYACLTFINFKAKISMSAGVLTRCNGAPSPPCNISFTRTLPTFAETDRS